MKIHSLILGSALILLLFACGLGGMSGTKIEPPSETLVLQMWMQQSELASPEITEASVSHIEECQSLSDKAKSDGVEAAWQVGIGFQEPCEGTKFCTDGKRPINTWDTVYVIDDTYYLEGNSFSEICLDRYSDSE